MKTEDSFVKVEISNENYKLLRKLQRQLKREGLNHSIDEIANMLLRDFLSWPREKQEEVLKSVVIEKTSAGAVTSKIRVPSALTTAPTPTPTTKYSPRMTI